MLRYEGTTQYRGVTRWPPFLSGASMAYLRGAWCSATYGKDPSARATFGLYRGNDATVYVGSTISPPEANLDFIKFYLESFRTQAFRLKDIFASEKMLNNQSLSISLHIYPRLVGTYRNTICFNNY